MFIALGIVIGFAFVSAFYASFLVYERENNVKHQQVQQCLPVSARCLIILLVLFLFQQRTGAAASVEHRRREPARVTSPDLLVRGSACPLSGMLTHSALENIE